MKGSGRGLVIFLEGLRKTATGRGQEAGVGNDLNLVSPEQYSFCPVK